MKCNTINFYLLLKLANKYLYYTVAEGYLARSLFIMLGIAFSETKSPPRRQEAFSRIADGLISE